MMQIQRHKASKYKVYLQTDHYITPKLLGTSSRNAMNLSLRRTLVLQKLYAATEPQTEEEQHQHYKGFCTPLFYAYFAGPLYTLYNPDAMRTFTIQPNGFKAIKKRTLLRTLPIVFAGLVAGIVASMLNTSNNPNDVNTLPFILPVIAIYASIAEQGLQGNFFITNC